MTWLFFFCLVVRDVRSLPPVWLHTLLRDKQWRKFSEVVRLLDKVDRQNKRLLSKMTEDALHAYVRSQEFRNNPQKLCSLLQEVGCQIHTPTTSDSIKTRHSVPQTVMSNNRLQSMDGETKRPSSYPTLTHHATKIAVSVAWGVTDIGMRWWRRTENKDWFLRGLEYLLNAAHI